MKKVKPNSIALAIAISIIILIVPTQVLASGTVIKVEPSATNLSNVGQTFNINITISQVTDLAAWDFQFYYPNAILNATNLIEGPFLRKAGSTSFVTIDFTDKYNATHGRVWAACTLIGQGAGADGNGTLATITFKAVGGGDGILHLAETDLLNSQMPIEHIPHTTEDGTIHLAGFRDLAITNIVSFKTVVGWGLKARIEVTVKNEGNYRENCTVITYANSTSGMQNVTIGSQNVTLGIGTSAVLNFTFTPSGSVKRTYIINAYVCPLQGETDLNDNRFADGTVKVTIPGDITGDGKVDIKDVSQVGANWQKTAPPAPYNVDINSDGKVDIKDVSIIGAHWQKDP